MRRVMVVLVMLLAVLVSGCSIFRPSPDPVPIPEPEPNPVPGKVVFETDSGYRICGMVWHKDAGLVVTCYKTARNPNTSRVYMQAQTGKHAPYENSAETIGQPIIVDKVIYFPQEHGDRYLFWDAMWGYMGTSAGRWSICGFNYKGQPALAFNDSYSGVMNDRPKIVNPVTREVLFEVPAKMMPRSMVEWEGAWCVAGDTGEAGTYVPGKKYDGNITHMAVMNGYLYGAGEDGGIYRMGSRGWTDRIETESSVAMHMISMGDWILYTGGRPNRLYELTSEKLRLLSKNDTPDSGGNFFGNSIAVNGDTIFWAYWNAVRKRGIVVKLGD